MATFVIVTKQESIKAQIIEKMRECKHDVTCREEGSFQIVEITDPQETTRVAQLQKIMLC